MRAQKIALKKRYEKRRHFEKKRALGGRKQKSDKQLQKQKEFGENAPRKKSPPIPPAP